MLKIKENTSLKTHNTFHLDVKARHFCKVRSSEEAIELAKGGLLDGRERFVLGRGANVLFTGDYDGIVIKMAVEGREVLQQDGDTVLLELGGGEDWPKVVEWTVQQGWSGIENLANVPGTVGAAPVQNIACYGHNLVDVFNSLEAVNLRTGEVERFKKEDCEFSYRSSIFKRRLRGQFLITRIRLELHQNPQLDTSYHSRRDSVTAELDKFTTEPYTIKDVYQAILRLRDRKLPDIKEVGSAGCFFENPVVTKEKLDELLVEIPDLQYYPVNQLTYPQPEDEQFNYEDHVKVPAGWLFEEIGWRGRREGNVGTWPQHSLIVVNYGGASPSEVIEFVEKMRQEFYDHYGIWLEDEVNVVGR